MDSNAALIANAITAGLIHTKKETPEKAVLVLYVDLRKLFQHDYHDHRELNRAMAELEMRPHSRDCQRFVEREIRASGADNHPEILELAQKLIDTLEHQNLSVNFWGDGSNISTEQQTGGTNIGEAENVYIGTLPQSLPATPPAPPEFFAGRQTLRKSILETITTSVRTVSIAIVGMGGSGKTVLANRVAHDANEKFRNNVFWGDLGAVQGDADSILRSWANFCGVEIPRHLNGEELASQVRGLLTQRKEHHGAVLAVIDDLRQEWLETGKSLRKAIPDGIPVLITSREISIGQALNVSKIIQLDSDEYLLSDVEACNLLTTRSENQIDHTQAKSIAQLCGKMPLALELAAQIARVEGSAYLLDSLRDGAKRLDALELLDGARRKEESVRITFEISYRALPRDTALVLRYLGAFAPVSIHATHLAQVLAHAKQNRIKADQELRRLKRYSLLQQSDDGKHFRMHALLHDYAQELLVGNEAKQAWRSHFTCFQAAAQEFTDMKSNERKTEKALAFQMLYPQLEQALVSFETGYRKAGSGTTQKTIRQLLGLVNILDGYWKSYNRFEDRMKWLPIAYQLAGKANLPLAQANLAERLGRVFSLQGELKGAMKWMKLCKSVLADKAGKEANSIRALMHIHTAAINFMDNNLKLAEKNCLRGIALVNPKKELDISAEGHNMLGAVRGQRGNEAAALKAFETSLAGWRQLDDQYEISRVEDNIRSALFMLGEIGQLRELEDQSLKYWKQFPERIEYAMALTNLGLVFHFDGQYEDALRCQQQALTVSDQLAAQRMRAMVRLNIAWTYIALKQYDQAEAHLTKRLEIQRDFISLNEYDCEAQRAQAEVAVGRGRRAQALEIATLALELAREEENPFDEGAALRTLSKANQLNLDLILAREQLESSQLLLHKKSFKLEEWLTLQALYTLYKELGEEQLAQMIASEILSLARKIGLVLPRGEIVPPDLFI